MLSRAHGFLCGVGYRGRGRFPNALARAFVLWKGQMYTRESVCAVLATRPLLPLMDLRLFFYFYFFINFQFLLIVFIGLRVTQWEERARQFLPSARVGRIRQDVIDVAGKDIVIAMLQSLVARGDEYPTADFGMVWTPGCLCSRPCVPIYIYIMCMYVYTYVHVHTCYVLTHPPIPSSRCNHFVVLRPV